MANSIGQSIFLKRNASWLGGVFQYLSGQGADHIETRGTFVANGATPVTVVEPTITASSIVTVTLKTVGGTVSPTVPNVQTITPGTGFTIAGVAADTSTYNYLVQY